MRESVVAMVQNEQGTEQAQLAHDNMIAVVSVVDPDEDDTADAFFEVSDNVANFVDLVVCVDKTPDLGSRCSTDYCDSAVPGTCDSAHTTELRSLGCLSVEESGDRRDSVSRSPWASVFGLGPLEASLSLQHTRVTLSGEDNSLSSSLRNLTAVDQTVLSAVRLDTHQNGTSTPFQCAAS
jgi:hypothetical protein